MHASPSNSETVCDVKLPCFVTKTVCMSKQNNSDLDYTFKRKKLTGSCLFFYSALYCRILDHQQSSHKSRGIFFFYLLCQFVFCFVINTILSNKTHVMQKWFQCYLFLWFFLSLSIKLSFFYFQILLTWAYYTLFSTASQAF